MKKFRWMLFAILLLSLTNCTPTPPDVFVFEQLSQHLGTNPVTGHVELRPSPNCIKAIKEPECGHGISIVNGKEIFVGETKETWFKGKPWSQLKKESVYLPAVESYAPLAKYIINSCEKMNCNDQVTRFKVKLDQLGSIGAAINNP